MRRYYTAIILSIVALTFAWIGVFYFQLSAPTAKTSWVYEAYQIKVDSAKNKEGEPRLLFASGSSTLYSVRTFDIEENLGIPAVNLAVHAGLDTRYMFDVVRRVAQDGDIVVLPLEYHMYTAEEDRWNDITVDYLVSRDEAYFHDLSVLEKARVVQKIGFGRMIQSIGNKFVSPKPEPTISIGEDEFIGYHVLNSNGDEMNNVSSQRSIGMISEQPPYEFFDTDDDRLQIIRDFVSWSRQNNITVIGAYPPMIDFEEYQNSEYRSFFNDVSAFWESIGVATMAAPLDFLYPPSLMYNSGYHLNDVGTTLHTQKLIELLRESDEMVKLLEVK